MIKKTSPLVFAQLKLNIKKAQGMLNKIDTMLEDDIHCTNIAQQINATLGLLKSMNTMLLKQHLKCCGIPNLSSKDTTKIDSFIEEFFKVIEMTHKK